MKARILLIEDDYSIGEVLKTAVELEGFDVFWARDGREGLKLAEVVAPSAVICDMMMPVLDGFGFLKEYRESGKTAPVIAVSAMNSYLEAARASGAAAALQKPLNLDELFGKVTELLENPRADERKAAPAAAPAGIQTSEAAEERRLDHLHQLRLDEPAPEEALHTFVDYVARLFHVPICLISVVTATKQYWTAMCGIEGDLKAPRGGPRQHSFCAHSVVAHAPLIVQNAASNPYFRDNPFVTQRGLRFYAGVPLITRGGEAVGTLCLLDFEPRVFTRLDLELLSVLSKRVLAELDRRERATHPAEPAASFPLLSYVDAETGLVGREGFMDVLRIQACRQVERRGNSALIAIEVPERHLRSTAKEVGRLLPDAWIGRLGVDRLAVITTSNDLNSTLEPLERTLTDEAKIAAIEMGTYCGSTDIALSIIEDQLSELSSKTPTPH